MKKIGVLLLVLSLLMGNAGFAVEGGDSGVSLSANQRMLFKIPVDLGNFSDIMDFQYNPDEELIYLVTNDEEDLDDASYNGYQFTFDLDGDFEDNPLYPELDISTRRRITFDEEGVYTMECGDYLVPGVESEEDELVQDVKFVYDAKNKEVLDEFEDFHRKKGFAIANPYIALLNDYCSTSDEDDPNFFLKKIESEDVDFSVVSPESGRISAYDFTPSGSEFIYGAYTCDEEAADGLGAGFRIISIDPTTGQNTGNDFLLTMPGDIDQADLNSGWRLNGFRGIVASEDYIVVLIRMESADNGDDVALIQRYSYDGDLLESYKTEYCVGLITEGPNDSTLYLRKNHDDSSYFDVMKVSWDIEEASVGRPKSVISERSFGGKTIATFKDDGFGLLKMEDPETGGLDYQAPLKSDQNDVRLRIPFADVQAKVASGANNLLIPYKGQIIKIPMNAFDCSDLLTGMPCQDDATFEVHLSADEAGNVKVTLQLFVVEQVNSMTKVVHRKTIQY